MLGPNFVKEFLSLLLSDLSKKTRFIYSAPCMETLQTITKKKVALQTLGCRLNFSETGSIAQGFVDRGYEVVPFGEAADLVFLNTCTVTDGADSSARNLIRKAQATAPGAKIVVAGCYAQMEANKVREQGADVVLGTSEKYRVFDYLEPQTGQIVKIEKTSEFQSASTTLADSRTRAFLKIQDGCNYVCSFCIIPFARGRSRTITVADAIAEAQKLVAQGFQEIVLTGVNVGEYESTSGEKLAELLRRLLDLEGIKRLRLGSIEPNTLTEEIMGVLKGSGKYQDHFHIPLQSGSDEILTAMRRKYDVARYKEVMSMVRSYFPAAAVGADVIAGFPGETEKQFLETFDLMREQPLTHFHVFPFSRRKNTTAAKLPNQVPSAERKQRVRTLIMLGQAKMDAFARDVVGQKSEVLFESQKDGMWEGYTSHFLRVRMKSEEDLSNQIRTVFLKGWNGVTLDGGGWLR